MYNLFFTTKAAVNKGKFTIQFPNEGLYFKDGTKLAISALNVYNSIHNISEYRKNNVFYIKLGTILDLTGLDNISSVHEDAGNSIYVYKITFPNGQYQAAAMDEFIAKRIGDWSEETNDYVAFANRKLRISVDPSFGKFAIYQNDTTNVLFKVGDAYSQNLAYLMGFDLSIDGTSSDKTTYNSVVYWDLAKYRNNHTNDGDLGFQKGNISNGRTAVHLHFRDNIVFGGFDASGSQSDTIFAFDFTVKP